ncbi:hypothetical protein FKG94_04955 [Exilibacterium tricleocarpae]|uniref:Uncharacterized protein n=1 Tax=Exilibacterium tricleocarpae TaxID=2591008 RepID=A0A545U3H9_9GAMM|nr:hypothetical protein [Exilibacterium tricleocarpae]TQV84018.1 hypothetical protein FKG94_04955 [Exilibacterium tricleocarpae]
MLKHIAVRLQKVHHAEIGFSLKNAKLVNAALEKRDPALKNLLEGLNRNGLEYVVDGCDLYWFQIEDERPLSFYASLNEVECVFDSSWFETEKEKIRHLSGVRYFDASAGLADQFVIKDQQRAIDYDISLVAAA